MAKGLRVKNYLFELIRKKELQENRRITNREVADALGVTANTLKNWMDQNVNQFSGDILMNAKTYFGVQSLCELIEFEEVEVDELTA